MKHRLMEGGAKASERLQRLYAPVRNELDEVEENLRSEFQSDDQFIDRLARHGLAWGGSDCGRRCCFFRERRAGSCSTATSSWRP